MEFEVGDRVMLKVSPWKGVVRFGKRGKLNPRYVGPFKVLAKVGKVAYRLELPQEYEAGYHWLRFAGTLGEVLSSPGNVKIRSSRDTHNFSQTGLRQPLQGLKILRTEALLNRLENGQLRHRTPSDRLSQPSAAHPELGVLHSRKEQEILAINPKLKTTNQEKAISFGIWICVARCECRVITEKDAKADIGIFIGYALAKKAFRIYNKRTQKIIKSIHVTFDELTSIASEHFSSGPGLQCMTPTTSSSGLVSNPISQQPCIPPRDDWDRLFQPMFNEYFTPLSNAVSQVQEAVALRAVDLADSPVSTSIDQDAPSSSTPSTQEQEQSPNISQGFEESPKTPIFHDDPLNESPHEESTSQRSSSNVRQIHTPFEHIGKWTKNHPIANVINDPSRSISMRKQLQTDAMWCYFFNAS
ncbi:hypothetical protein Tco_0840922 [Tanacetum coccineum]|uniref:Reverse transcriptase domain-containing protein n=1 Tax=Tanacetum coccineum TaxID=301880 RepID=A0ABQ5AUZ2_9ASTR